MTETPESKALRDLVTAIKKGRKPDVTAAEAVLRRIPESYVLEPLEALWERIYSAAEKARDTVLEHPDNRTTVTSYRSLTARAEQARAAVYRPLISARDKLLSDARAGKLTKKQFDKAVKDFFK